MSYCFTKRFGHRSFAIGPVGWLKLVQYRYFRILLKTKEMLDFDENNAYATY
jgi:hypothetical protein